ncbi:MAG: CotH kinase family protein [Arenicella sp.]
MKANKLYNWALVALFSLLCVMLLLFTWFPSWHAFDQYLKTPYLPTAMLDQGKKGKIIKQLGLVYAEVNDGQRYQKNTTVENDEEEVPINLFQRKRRVGDYLYRANVGGKANFPSRIESDADKIPHQHITQVSLGISDAALFDENLGILLNAGQSGRKWERPATLSIYRGNQMSLAQNVGVRLYGEKGVREQLKGNLEQSYEVFFRSRYSVDEISGGTVFNASQVSSLSGLVLEQGDVVKRLLAMDLWRAAGLRVPAYGPALLSINGHNLGVRLAHEPVTSKQWLLRTANPWLDFYRSDKGATDQGWRWNVELTSWHRQVRGTLTMELVNTYIDLENLTRNIAAHMVCGSSDWPHWAIVRDRNAENRWRWIEWEMSTCFSDDWHTSKGSIAEQHWLRIVMTRKPGKLDDPWHVTHRDLRTRIFTELMNNDPDYQAYFLSILEDVMQKLTTDDGILERLHHYRSLWPKQQLKGDSTGEHLSFDDMELFLQQRSHFIRKEIKRYFNTASSVPNDI